MPSASPLTAPAIKRRRRRRRRLAKLAGWLLVMALLSGLVTAVLGWMVYRNLTEVVNSVLKEAAAPFSIVVDEASILGRDRVRVSGARIRHQSQDEPLLQLGELELQFDPGVLLKERRFSSIRLVEPNLKVDDALLQALRESDAGTPQETSELPKSDGGLVALGRLADELKVEGGRMQLRLKGLPHLDFDFELETRDLDFSDEGLRVDRLAFREGTGRWSNGEEGRELWPVVDFLFEGELTDVTYGQAGLDSAPNQEVVIRAVQVGSSEQSEGQALRAEELWLRFDLGDLIRGKRMEEIRVMSPELLMTRDSLARWWDRLEAPAGDRSDGPLPEPREGKKSMPPKSGVEQEPLGGWSLGRLEWRDGSFRADLPIRGLESKSEGSLDFEVTESGEQGVFDLEGRAGLSGKVGGGVSVRVSPEFQGVVDLGGASVRDMAIRLRHGRLRSDRSIDGLETLPLGQLDFEASLSGLGRAEGQWIAEGVQEFNFTDIQLGSGVGDEETAIEADHLEVRANLEALLQRRSVEQVKVSSPSLRINDSALDRWLNPLLKDDSDAASGTPTMGVTNPSASPRLETPKSPPWKVMDLEIVDGTFDVDLKRGGKRWWGQGQFAISGGAESSGGILPVAAKFRDVRLLDPEAWGLPLAQMAGRTGARDVVHIKRVEVKGEQLALQREHFIEEIEVEQPTLVIGQALREMVQGGETDEADKVESNPPVDSPLIGPVDGGASRPDLIEAKQNQGPTPTDRSPEENPEAGAEKEPEESAGVPKKAWTVGKLKLKDGRVRFDTLIPEIRGLEFAVSTEMSDIPLSKEGMLSQDALQKVELTRIDIRDPYDGFIKVAYLPTIFVEFSLAGLARKEVEKIELLSPTLYVGQGLFWWVDYQRNHRATNEGEGVGLDGEEGAVPAKKQDWKINQIDAHLGRIVLAPLGSSIGIVPFPFSASTNLKDGTIALKLEIPKEQYVYSFPEKELDLYGLSGTVDFNVPIEQEDNNLVQVFKLDRAVWKQFELETIDAWVTYDQKGVYAQFGGEAYGGYAQGAFNFYLQEVGKWDGWVSITELDMGALSQILAPQNLLMNGVVSGKLVSEGRKLDLGETRGDFSTDSAGWMDITKLDSVIESLPEEWSVLQRSLTSLAIQGLKIYHFDRGQGELNLKGQEGRMKMEMEGPNGNRVINVELHDERRQRPEAPLAAAEAAREGEIQP